MNPGDSLDPADAGTPAPEGPAETPAPEGAPKASREERLLRITSAICDGAAVDWNAERQRSPDLRELIRCLEMLERIRNASRT